MENHIKPFGWRRDIFFIKECFIVLFRRFKEYRANAFSFFFSYFVWFIIQLFLLKILNDNFGAEIGWTFDQFILFAIFLNLTWNILGIFNWGEGVETALRKGNMNVFIPKPLGIKFKFYFSQLDESGFLYVLSTLIYVILTLIYFNPNITYSFLGGLALFFNMIFFALLWLAFDTFNFYSLGISRLFEPIREIDGNLQAYPGSFFKETKIKYLLNLFPMYFAATLLVPLFSGNVDNEIYFQFFLLLVLNLICLIILIINWHYGLKKYEAFG